MSKGLEPGATLRDFELRDDQGVPHRFWGRPSIHQLWADLQEIHARIKPEFDPTTAEARAAWERDRAAAVS